MTSPRQTLWSPDAHFMWDKELQKAFEHSKEEIIKQVERGIKTFDMGKQTCLLTDWSKTGIGLKLQNNCDCEPLTASGPRSLKSSTAAMRE